MPAVVAVAVIASVGPEKVPPVVVHWYVMFVPVAEPVPSSGAVVFAHVITCGPLTTTAGNALTLIDVVAVPVHPLPSVTVSV